MSARKSSTRLSSTNRRSSKKQNEKRISNKRTLSSTLYQRTSQQILRPSVKINDGWTHLYTTKFQQLWSTFYLEILENETDSKFPTKSTSISNGKNGVHVKQSSKRTSNKFIRKRTSSKIKPKHHAQSSSQMFTIPKKGYLI